MPRAQEELSKHLSNEFILEEKTGSERSSELFRVTQLAFKSAYLQSPLHHTAATAMATLTDLHANPPLGCERWMGWRPT